MVKAKLSDNPCLVEIEIRVYGQSPKITINDTIFVLNAGPCDRDVKGPS